MSLFGLGGDPERAEAEVAAEVASGQGFGGHSMVAPLKRAIMQEPAPPSSDHEWSAYGYTHPIDHDATLAEHAALRDLLTSQGVEVIYQPPAEPGELDSIFVYDTSIITDTGALLVRPGKELRQVEVDRAALHFGELGVPLIGRVEGPGTAEGGDTMWIDSHTLAVGQGYRTNSWGIDQMRIFLQPCDVDVVPVALPHWHGPEECLHLLSLISPVDERTAMVYPSLISTPFMQLLNELEWTLIPIPEEEFATQATNILAIAPNKVVMLKDNVRTIETLEKAGVEVLTYTGDHISHNRQGGPTCLVKPLLRDVASAE